MLISDHLLLNYKRCNRRTFLEIYGDRENKDPDKDFLLKLKRENQTHIRNVIASLSLEPQQPEASRRDAQLNAQQTREMMQQGVNCIIRGSLSVDSQQWQASLSESLSGRYKTKEHQDFLD
ncbi:MAG: recombinase B, partial [Cyanobacteria bacterium J06553_1]